MKTPKLFALSALAAAMMSITTVAPAQTTLSQSGSKLLIAQSDDSDRGAGRHHGKRQHKGKRGHGMKKMLRGLDLTETQRDEIFQLRHANAPVMRETRKKMNAARRELKALATSTQADATRVEQLSTELGQTAAQVSRARFEMLNQIFQILTPEQRVKLKERIERKRGQRGRA